MIIWHTALINLPLTSSKTFRLIHSVLTAPPVLVCFPGGSDGKESACNAEDPGSIPGSGRSSGEENGNPLQYSWIPEFHGQRSLAGYSSWHCKEWDMTEQVTLSLSHCPSLWGKFSLSSIAVLLQNGIFSAISVNKEYHSHQPLQPPPMMNWWALKGFRKKSISAI